MLGYGLLLFFFFFLSGVRGRREWLGWVGLGWDGMGWDRRVKDSSVNENPPSIQEIGLTRSRLI